MENASKDRDLDLVEKEHANTLEMYAKTASAVKDALGMNDGAQNAEAEDDDEIMEFAPTK